MTGPPERPPLALWEFLGLLCVAILAAVGVVAIVAWVVG